MIKCFNKIRKPCFWSIFGPFSKFWGQNKKFLENPAMSNLTFYGFLATCQNLEKTNDAILKKRPDSRKHGRKDGGPIQVLPGVQLLLKPATFHMATLFP